MLAEPGLISGGRNEEPFSINYAYALVAVMLTKNLSVFLITD